METFEQLINDLDEHSDLIALETRAGRNTNLRVGLLGKKVIEVLEKIGNVDKKFLSRINTDEAQELIKFLGGAQFGNFISSLYTGTGAGIDKHGNAEFESLTVRSYMMVMELIINRLSAIQGDVDYTEGDTIERVELINGEYRLHLKKDYPEYFTAQKEGNILRGIINDLASGGADYYTSWMRVNNVNTVMNYIDVILYPDDEVPAGKNFPPIELMKISRRGNQTDLMRQSSMSMSSTEGMLVHLVDVMKPILDASNWGSTIGKLPSFLRDMGLPIGEREEGIYTKTLIAQNFIRFDHLGKPMVEPIDRGRWESGVDYFFNSLNIASGLYETSDVWHLGCKWRCMKNLTKVEPSWLTTDWMIIQGRSDARMEFYSDSEGGLPSGFTDFSILPVVFIGDNDVSADIAQEEWRWTRDSHDKADDIIWNNRFKLNGRKLTIDADDLGAYWGEYPVVLTCRAKYPASVINELKHTVEL